MKFINLAIRNKKFILLKLTLATIAVVICGFILFPVTSFNLIPQVASARLEIRGDGTTEIKSPDSDWVKGTSGALVTADTSIKTDDNSSAEILYPDGTVTQLDNNTTVLLKELKTSPKTVLVGLEKGRIWSNVAKLGQGESYQTQSKTATTTVHGTAYSHEVLADGEDRIIVTQSRVTLICRDPDNKTEKEVDEGNMLTADCYKQLFSSSKPANINQQVSQFSTAPMPSPTSGKVQGIQTIFQVSNPSTQPPTSLPSSTPRPTSSSNSTATKTPTPTPTPTKTSSPAPPPQSPISTSTPTATNPPTSNGNDCQPPYGRGGKPEECK